MTRLARIEKWSVTTATAKIMQSLGDGYLTRPNGDQFEIKLRATLNGHVAFIKYDRWHTPESNKHFITTTRNAIQDLHAAAEWLDRRHNGFDHACIDQFDLLATEVATRLRKIGDEVDRQVNAYETRFSTKRGNPPHVRIDEFIAELAHLHWSHNDEPLACNRPNKQRQLHDNFKWLLEAVWEALPIDTAVKPARVEGFLKRARNRSQLLMESTPLHRPRFYRTAEK